MHHNSLRVVCIVVVQLFAIACSKVSFYGRTETGRNFADGMDAIYGKGAQLANLPSNPTNSSNIDIKVHGENVTKYIYSLINSDELCQTVKYSAVESVASNITMDLNTEGTKRICVKGSTDDRTFQSNATEYVWTIDKTPPQSFSLTGLQAASKNFVSQLAWTEAAGADSYVVNISSAFDCKSNTSQSITTSNLNTAITQLKDGIYFICAQAKDLAGNETNAANSPFRMVIDTTPPGNFHIYEPLSLINSTLPKIKWTSSTDSVSYLIRVSNDAACVSNVETHTLVSTIETQMTVALQDAHTYYICASSFDSIGNETKAAVYEFTVDTTGLMISFDPATRPLPNSKATTPNITVTSTSSDFAQFKYAMGPVTLDCANESNYSAAIAATSPIPATTITTPDGLYKVCAIGGDRAGNWMKPATVGGFISYQWRKDSTSPSLAFAVPSVCGPNNCGGAAVANIPITNYASSDAGSGLDKVEVVISPLSATVYPVTPAGLVLPKSLFLGRSGTYAITATATDQSGNTTILSQPFIWDQIDPVMSTFSLEGILNSSPKEISKPNTTANLIATERHSGVKDICFRSTLIVPSVAISTTKPIESDSCWVSASSLNASGLGSSAATSRVPYVIGFIGPETYKGQVWIRDAALNVSNLLEDEIRYIPSAVPELTSALASSQNNASPTVTATERIFVPTASNAKLYIKWIAKDEKALPLKPIQLFYTHNDVDWLPVIKDSSNQPVSIAANIRSGCSTSSPIDTAAEQAGCYVWSPTATTALAGYTKIRVAVTDSDEQVTFSTAPIINVPQLNFLAGNTEIGIGASARSTIFQNTVSGPARQDPASMVVTKKGEIIFRDNVRGIFKVSADSGIQQILVRLDPNKVATDGTLGSTGTGTVGSPLAIALDDRDGIIVLEKDRLRRIDLQSGTIQSLAGHLTTSIKYNEDDATSNTIKIDLNTLHSDKSIPTLYTIPSSTDASKGKIVFISNTSLAFPSGLQTMPMQRLRVLNVDTGNITSVKFKGAFNFANEPSSHLLENCRVWSMAVGFDKNSGNFNSAVVNAMGNSFDPNNNTSRFWENCRVASNYKVKYMAASVGGDQKTMTVLDSTNLDLEAYLWGTAVVGMDGKIYHVDRTMGEILQFNIRDNKFKKIVGKTITNGTADARLPGSCADGTLALECHIDPQDVFVAADGRVFFMDRGRLRTLQGDINNNTATVVTIMGQSYGYGDGLNALSARFGIVNSFARWTDSLGKQKLVILDALEQKFREAEIGGNMSLIAGNGVSADVDMASQSTGSPKADAQTIAIDSAGRNIDNFELRPSNGNIIFRTRNEIIELNRSTKYWMPFAGKGATSWRTANDGQLSNAVNMTISGVYPQILGLYMNGTNSSLMFMSTFIDKKQQSGETAEDSYLMSFNETSLDRTFKRLAGKSGPSANRVTDFSESVCLTSAAALNAAPAPVNQALNCPLVSGYSTDYMSATPDTRSGQLEWIVAPKLSNTIMKITAARNLVAYRTLARDPIAFAIKKHTTDERQDVVFYCGLDGVLTKMVGLTDTPLSLGLDAGPNRLMCSGRQMEYDAGNDRLTFIYKQNGLTGIAEYINP